MIRLSCAESVNGKVKDYVRFVPDFVPVSGQARCVDNLEYHLMSREHEYVNSLQPSPMPLSAGQAMVSLQPNPSMGSNGPQIAHNPMVGVRRVSGSDMEEMSDEHDYYNEFDRLQRELQPLNLRRNETTV